MKPMPEALQVVNSATERPIAEPRVHVLNSYSEVKSVFIPRET